jgi:erythronate-4-phosphate dehydrogenase
MNIFYEDSMPYAADFFQGLGKSQVFSHKTIQAEQLRDADVLLVRSTTKVNAELLAQAHNLQFVGTATAGTNHVDINATLLFMMQVAAMRWRWLNMSSAHFL